MKIISSVLKKALYPSLSRAGAFRRSSASGLAVVTYHGVLPQGYEPLDSTFDGHLIRADMLRRQLRLLKAHYNLISPDDALAWRAGLGDLPPRSVLLTCDDGLLNCVTDMLPVLQEEQVCCLFFVTGASTAESRSMQWYEELFLLFLRAPAGPFHIASAGIAISGDLQGRENRRMIWWDCVKRLSQTDAGSRTSFLHAARIQFGLDGNGDFDLGNFASSRRFGLLTCSELRELATSGMAIGAHTLTHPMLSQLPPELAYAEISEIKICLESLLQKTVWALAYPFGDPQSVTPQVLEMAQRAGYLAAFLNFGGGLGVDLPPYALPRIHVSAGMSLGEFEAHVSGFYGRLQRLAGRGPDVGTKRIGIEL